MGGLAPAMTLVSAVRIAQFGAAPHRPASHSGPLQRKWSLSVCGPGGLRSSGAAMDRAPPGAHRSGPI